MMNAVFLFPLLDDKHWVLLEVTIVHGKRGDIKVYDSFVDPVNWKLGGVSKKYGGHVKLAWIPNGRFSSVESPLFS